MMTMLSMNMKPLPLGMGLLAAFVTTASVQAEVKIPNSAKTGEFFIGCQAYTFNRFTVFEAIDKNAGLHYGSLLWP